MGRPRAKFDAPSWFDLKKYEPTKRWGLREWFLQIKRRLDADLFQPMGATSHQRELKAEHQRRLRNIWDNPVEFEAQWESGSRDPLWNLGGIRVINLTETPQETGPAESLKQAPFICDDKKSVTSIRFGELEYGEMIAAQPSENVVVSGPSPEQDNRAGCPELSINLELPDEVLIAGFGYLLTQIRNQPQWKQIIPLKKPTKRVNEALLESWVQYAILPYWDVRLWAEENGKPFQSTAASRLIFPRIPPKSVWDYYGNAKTIQDFTKPKAESTFSWPFLHTLWAEIVLAKTGFASNE